MGVCLSIFSGETIALIDILGLFAPYDCYLIIIIWNVPGDLPWAARGRQV